MGPRRGPALLVAAVTALVALVVVLSQGGGASSPPSTGSLPASTPTTAPTTAPTTPTTAPPTPPPTPAPKPAPAPAPAPGREAFGASVNLLFNDRLFTGGQIAAQLAALHATGAAFARSDAFWEATEPAAPTGGVHHYDWTFDDTIAAALAAHGLAWLPILDYTAPWAQSIPGQDHSPPAAPAGVAAYAAYAGAFATRYGPGGAFWAAHPSLRALPITTFEIWNEPDNPEFWTPAPDAAGYAALYAQARAVIHAVQPNARVLIGGLTHPARFLPAMLQADPGLRGAIDGVAVHPYAPSVPAVLARVRRARRTLAALRLGSVPLYVTEFGWATRPPHALDGAPESERPGLIERTLAALGATDCGVAASVLYTWVSPERDPTDHEDWFGISPPSGGTSPDVAAFTRGIQAGSRAPADGCAS